jgi:hypothetical protein
MRKRLIFIGLILVLSVSAFAQTKKRTSSKTKKPVVAKPVAPVNETVDNTPVVVPPKKNERPEAESSNKETEPKKKNQGGRTPANAKPEKIIYPYVYDFSQPNFVISHIVIEHDATGKGTITFEKSASSGDPIVDPIQLSESALERINKLFGTLNFLSSTEDYQSPTRDYGHLGNHTVTLRKDNLERTTKYNWSENKDARALADEYRKIGEQYIWYFDMNIARENLPLDAPNTIDRLDSLLRRDEISDPSQMLPYLKVLSNDERVPLLGRNHVLRIIKEIEKNLAKNKDK